MFHLGKKPVVAIAVISVIADQLSKWWAVQRLTSAFGDTTAFGERLSTFLWHRHPRPVAVVEVVESFWHFRYVENPGAAWGFLSGSAAWFRTPFFLVMSTLAMGFMVYYFRQTRPGQWLVRLALALVFGGAVGNFLDRVRLGYVIDFIDWHWYDAHWPTFNIADACISVGVCLMVIDMLGGESALLPVDADSQTSAR